MTAMPSTLTPKLETTRDRVESWIHTDERNQIERVPNLTLKDARELLHDLTGHRASLMADVDRIARTKHIIKSALLSEGNAE